MLNLLSRYKIGMVTSHNKKTDEQNCSSSFFAFAEREGFEPPVPLSTPVFKTGVIDHSTISPKVVLRLCGCKDNTKLRIEN